MQKKFFLWKLPKFSFLLVLTIEAKALEAIFCKAFLVNPDTFLFKKNFCYSKKLNIWAKITMKQ